MQTTITLHHSPHTITKIPTQILKTNLDYNLDIIIPIYCNLRDFQLTLSLNYPYFNQLGIRLIIVVDEPMTLDDFVFIKQYQNLDYLVIVNQKQHDRRNLAKAINVGLRQAQREFVLILKPDLILTSNIFELLYRDYYRYMTEEKNELHNGYFMTIPTVLISADQLVKKYFSLITRKKFDEKRTTIGPLFAYRQNLLDLGGYGERLAELDDENEETQLRMIRYGFYRITLDQEFLINIGHPWLTRSSSETNDFLNKTYNDKLQFTTHGHDFNSLLLANHCSIDNRSELMEIGKQVLQSIPTITDFIFGQQLKQHYLIMGLLILNNVQHSVDPSILKFVDGLIVIDCSTTVTPTSLTAKDYSLKVSVKDRNELTLKNLLIALFQQIFNSHSSVVWLMWLESDERLIYDQSQETQIKNQLKYQTTDGMIINFQHPHNEPIKIIRLFRHQNTKLPYLLRSVNHLIPYETNLIGHLPLTIEKST